MHIECAGYCDDLSSVSSDAIPVFCVKQVRETRRSHKDSGTGEMRMAIGHHISKCSYMVSYVVEKENILCANHMHTVHA